ncbi:MAG: hypothetical protein ACYSTY_11690, partial [Planctomycetota bacterium]|jgi:hypothetical protein
MRYHKAAAAATPPPGAPVDGLRGRGGGGSGGGFGGGSRRAAGYIDKGTARFFGEPADAPHEWTGGRLREQANGWVWLDSADDASFGQDKERLEELKDVLGRVEEEDRRDEDGQAPGRGFLGDIPLLGDAFRARDPNVPYVNNRPVFAEHVAIAIDALVKEGEVDEAKSLADRFAEAKPDYEIAVAMRDTFDDDGLNETERDAKIAELAEQARQAIRDVVAEARRQARLQRILDPVLLELVRNPENLAIGRDVKFLERGVLLSILVKQTDVETLKALKEVGLTVEGTSKSINLVVGTAPLRTLEKLALLEQVRRIEPTRAE